MDLTRKERMRRALRYESVDHIPTQINYTGNMGLLLADRFGVSVEELPVFLGNHMLRVDLQVPPKFNEDKSVKFDWWGVGFDTQEEGYFAAVSPLQDLPDLDKFPWPDPNDPTIFEDAAKTIEIYGDEFFITPNFGFVLFERAWVLRGFKEFFMDMPLDEGYASELLDRIVEIQLGLIEHYIELGVDGGYFGDDYGAQQNLLFSPKMWRKFIKPRLARLFEPFLERGLPVMMHSDGRIQKILPDLVEIGLTTLNPVQPEVLEYEWLAENFGGKLSFYGGISTQTVLPFGTPREVRQAVARCAEVLAPHGTGLLIAPSHRMMTDVPMGNVDAMMDAFKSL